MKLTFHWRLLQGGETANMTRAGEGMRRETGLPDLERQVEFCRRAEEYGITGLLTDIGATKPDPILLSAALGMATEKIEFIVAYRSGLIPPTTFGMFRVLYCWLPGSTRSGEKHKKKSLPTCIPGLDRIGSITSSVVPG